MKKSCFKINPFDKVQICKLSQINKDFIRYYLFNYKNTPEETLSSFCKLHNIDSEVVKEAYDLCINKDSKIYDYIALGECSLLLDILSSSQYQSDPWLMVSYDQKASF